MPDSVHTSQLRQRNAPGVPHHPSVWISSLPLPSAFAYTLFQFEILGLLTGFSLNKASGSLLSFLFKIPIWETLGVLFIQTPTEGPTACPSCCHPNKQTLKWKNTLLQSIYHRPHFFWVSLLQDVTTGCSKQGIQKINLMEVGRDAIRNKETWKEANAPGNELR